MSVSNIGSDSRIPQQQSRASKPFLSERENPFSHSVLIGNWFEERFANEIDRRAVAPAVYGESECAHKKTVYKNDFQQPIQMGHREDFDEYIQWRQKSFSNRLNSEQTNIQLWDGDQFANNLTTFKDIMFRIRPQKELQDAATKRRSHDDYMRSYGNSTKTGLLQWLACEKQKERQSPIDVSHYKNNFKAIKLAEKRVLHKATQRKTYI